MPTSTSKQRGSSAKPKQSLRRLPIRTSRYWGHGTGRNVKQAVFLGLPNLEALYGGAAGGGKSDALLMAALQYVDCPGYSALLLRKTYPELAQAGGLIDRSLEWLGGTDAKWNEQKHRWVFPSGARLEFGYLARTTDRFRYQGAEFDFIGFDELTHFTEEDYRYLFSRLRRREGSRIPPRMRGASNPGNRGHRWVKERFIEKPVPGRLFIPAKLNDNPGVDKTAYLRALEELDPQTRAQLLEGDWEAREPGLWVFDTPAIDAAVELGREFDALLKQGKMVEPVGQAIASGVDWGDFATAAEIIWPLERGGVYVCPGEVTASRSDLEVITEQMLAAAGAYPYWFAEERYDSSFAQSNRTFARLTEQRMGSHNPIKRTGRPNTYPVSFAKYKLLAIKYLRLLLRRTLDGEGTRVLAISPTNTTLLEQMRGLREDERGMPVKGDDDSVDALIAGVAPVAKAHRQAIEEMVEEAATLEPEQVA